MTLFQQQLNVVGLGLSFSKLMGGGHGHCVFLMESLSHWIYFCLWVYIYALMNGKNAVDTKVRCGRCDKRTSNKLFLYHSGQLISVMSSDMRWVHTFRIIICHRSKLRLIDQCISSNSQIINSTSHIMVVPRFKFCLMG